MKATKWKTRPISPTCEVLRSVSGNCGRATSYAYPAMGGGWMALCECHAQKHLAPGGGCTHIEELIRRGERFE